MLNIDQQSIYFLSRMIPLIYICISLLLITLRFFPFWVGEFFQMIYKVGLWLKKDLSSILLRRGESMHLLKYSAILILLFVIIISCSSDTPFQPQDNSVPPAVKLSQFSEIQKQILTPSCATSGCHAGANSPWSLDLTDGNAYAILVNVNSGEAPALKRVLAGNAGQSFLIRKLEGNGTTLMPPGGMLSQAMIDSVKKWINDGALNN